MSPRSAGDPICRGCGRVMRGDKGWCVYCGWADGKAEPSHAGPVEAGTYRSGATFASCVYATLVYAPVLAFLAYEAVMHWRDTAKLGWLIGLSAVLFLMGPVPLAVQFIRRRFRWVRIDPDRGLDLSGRRLIPWENVVSVVKTPDRAGPSRIVEQIPTRLGTATAVHHGCAAAFFMHHLIAPILVILSPWHPRVTITLPGEERVVYRDLEMDEQFVVQVRRAKARRSSGSS